MILIIGAGTIGCQVAKAIVESGFSCLAILDFDIVESSNLLTQTLYSQLDIGLPKVFAAKSYLSGRYGVAVEAYFGKLEDQVDDFYEKFDYVIGCIDNIKSRRNLNYIISCLGKRPVIIDCGSGGVRGQVKIVNFGITSCLECVIPLYSSDEDSEYQNLCSIKAVPVSRTSSIATAAYIDFPGTFGHDFSKKSPHHIRWILERANHLIESLNLGRKFDMGEFVSIYGLMTPADPILNSKIARFVVQIVCGEFVDSDFITFYKDENCNIIENRHTIIRDSNCCVCGSLGNEI